jgi:GTP cyclohydrolase I
MSENRTKLQETLKAAFSSIIHAYGEQTNEECLKNTPSRAAETFHFLTQGYRRTLKSVVNGAVYNTDSNDLVLVQDIEFYSLCEHHLLPMVGKCHIAYLPNKKILGVSKMPRIVDLYARRLQLQERLTDQIAQAIDQSVQPHGTLVIMEASHLCVLMRGVEKQHPLLKTIATTGVFEDLNKQTMVYNLLTSRS